jgi:uncharacterized protein
MNETGAAPRSQSGVEDHTPLVHAPLIGFGHVRHSRIRPASHAFSYPTYFFMLPMRSLRREPAASTALVRNRFGWLSFFDSDHGDGRSDSLAWLDELLVHHGIADAVGEVWLHAYPRVLGYAFKPVSFWYCHAASGSLRAIVVEVNNTFGERHCYLLDSPRYGAELTADKVFHVSPFCTLAGRYRFRFMHAGSVSRQAPWQQTVASVDYDDDSGPLLHTSVSGELEPLCAASLRKAFWRYPAMTFGVMAHIHWQAFRLWRKHVPLASKPPAPDAFVTR